jgi:hypothetical protein
MAGRLGRRKGVAYLHMCQMQPRKMTRLAPCAHGHGAARSHIFLHILIPIWHSKEVIINFVPLLPIYGNKREP